MAFDSEVEAIQPLWEKYLANDEKSTKRWIQLANDPPCRQKALAYEASADQKRVYIGQDRLWRWRDENGKSKIIVTIDKMCRHVIYAFVSRTVKDKAKFESNQLRGFHGTRRSDIRFILKHLQERKGVANLCLTSSPTNLDASLQPEFLLSRIQQVNDANNPQRLSVVAPNKAASAYHANTQGGRPQPVTPIVKFNDTQEQLWTSRKVRTLLDAYVETSFSPHDGSHFRLGLEDALRIFRSYKPAKRNTLKFRADLIVITSPSILSTHLNFWRGDKCVLIQGLNPMRDLKASQVFDGLNFATRTLRPSITVADSSRKASENSTTIMSLEEAQWRWNSINQNRFPLHLLDLPTIYDLAHVYDILRIGYSLLEEAIDSIERPHKSTNTSPHITNDKGQKSGISGTSGGLGFSTHNNSYAQAGVCTRWHMDPLASFVLMTVEGTTDPKQPVVPLVLYSFVRTDNLKEDQVSEVLEMFKKGGPNYQPPSNIIRTICLRNHDSLLIPPGTIQSFVVVQDTCLIQSRAMSARFTPIHMRFWKYITENPHCAERESPRWQRLIVHHIQKVVLDNPGKHGYEEEDLDEFIDACAIISRDDLACGCASGVACSAENGCTCVDGGLPCTISCHDGDGKCCGNLNGFCPKDLD